MTIVKEALANLTPQQRAELAESFRQMLKSQKVLPRKLRIRRSK